jgi:hypothetical protein
MYRYYSSRIGDTIGGWGADWIPGMAAKVEVSWQKTPSDSLRKTLRIVRK